MSNKTEHFFYWWGVIVAPFVYTFIPFFLPVSRLTDSSLTNVNLKRHGKATEKLMTKFIEIHQTFIIVAICKIPAYMCFD